MDPFIPKEKLTAYERWELAALNEERSEAQSQPGPHPIPEPDLVPAATLLPLPTPEEIESLRADAREVGKTEGFAAGFAAGRNEGLALAQLEADRLRAIAEEFQSTLARAEDRFADELLALALAIAKQVVRTSLRTRPEMILPSVREAMSMIIGQHGHPTLFLHPDDAELVRSRLADQFSHSSWRLAEDSALTPGECRIENAGSEIDARLATRWRRVAESIGTRSDWLDDTS